MMHVDYYNLTYLHKLKWDIWMDCTCYWEMGMAVAVNVWTKNLLSVPTTLYTFYLFLYSC